MTQFRKFHGTAHKFFSMSDSFLGSVLLTFVFVVFFCFFLGGGGGGGQGFYIEPENFPHAYIMLVSFVEKIFFLMDRMRANLFFFPLRCGTDFFQQKSGPVYFFQKKSQPKTKSDVQCILHRFLHSLTLNSG